MLSKSSDFLIFPYYTMLINAPKKTAAAVFLLYIQICSMAALTFSARSLAEMFFSTSY